MARQPWAGDQESGFGFGETPYHPRALASRHKAWRESGGGAPEGAGWISPGLFGNVVVHLTTIPYDDGTSPVIQLSGVNSSALYTSAGVYKGIQMIFSGSTYNGFNVCAWTMPGVQGGDNPGGHTSSTNQHYGLTMVPSGIGGNMNLHTSLNPETMPSIDYLTSSLNWKWWSGNTGLSAIASAAPPNELPSFECTGAMTVAYVIDAAVVAANRYEVMFYGGDAQTDALTLFQTSSNGIAAFLDGADKRKAFQAGLSGVSGLQSVIWSFQTAGASSLTSSISGSGLSKFWRKTAASSTSASPNLDNIRIIKPALYNAGATDSNMGHGWLLGTDQVTVSSAQRSFRGKIKEVIVYNDYLSKHSCNFLTMYLHDRWNIT